MAFFRADDGRTERIHADAERERERERDDDWFFLVARAKKRGPRPPRNRITDSPNDLGLGAIIGSLIICARDTKSRHKRPR